MKIIITGASGLLGRALVQALSTQHQLSLVSRDIKRIQSFTDHELLTWQQLLNPDHQTLANSVSVQKPSDSWQTFRMNQV